MSTYDLLIPIFYSRLVLVIIASLEFVPGKDSRPRIETGIERGRRDHWGAFRDDGDDNYHRRGGDRTR